MRFASQIVRKKGGHGHAAGVIVPLKCRAKAIVSIVVKFIAPQAQL